MVKKYKNKIHFYRNKIMEQFKCIYKRNKKRKPFQCYVSSICCYHFNTSIGILSVFSVALFYIGLSKITYCRFLKQI